MMNQDARTTEHFNYGDYPESRAVESHEQYTSSPSIRPAMSPPPQQQPKPELADSINSRPSMSASKEAHNPDASAQYTTAGDIESINSHIEVVDAGDNPRKSQGRISYHPRRKGYWQVLVLILVTLAVAIAHMLLSFLRLIDNQFDDLHGYLDRIVVYQFTTVRT